MTTAALDREERVRDVVDRDIADHTMTVLRDDGLYRHLRFQRADGSSFYWFDLVTWPGVLTISGDCGCFVFSRTRDMFEFFAGPRTGPGINPHYWSEKLRAPAGRSEVKVYSREAYEKQVREWLTDRCEELDDEESAALHEAVRFDLLDEFGAHDEHDAHERLRNFKHGNIEISDPWEWDLREWDHHFLWCCWAIVRGIARYRAESAPSKEIGGSDA